MTTAEQTQAFANDIQKVVERYRAEFELTVAAAVGVLELVKLDLYMEERYEIEGKRNEYLHLHHQGILARASRGPRLPPMQENRCRHFPDWPQAPSPERSELVGWIPLVPGMQGRAA